MKSGVGKSGVAPLKSGVDIYMIIIIIITKFIIKSLVVIIAKYQCTLNIKYESDIKYLIEPIYIKIIVKATQQSIEEFFSHLSTFL